MASCNPVAPAQTPAVNTPPPSSPQLPVAAHDAAWGEPSAPVTLVAFLDFECFFCARAHITLQELQESYGPESLRVVVKHAPLPFHRRALPAAVAASAVQRLAGSAAFFEYMELLFSNVEELSDANLNKWAREVGVAPAEFSALLADEHLQQAVAQDLELASSLGVNGVPAFFINGVPLVGARPVAEFQLVIDHELKAGQALRAQGVAPAQLYAERVRVNAQAQPEAAAETAWQVPVGTSPTLGTAQAWVTIVEFADFQCPFCRDAHHSLHSLMAKYPGKVRWVMKHNPLGFHPQAEPAALLALAVREQRGDIAYFQAVDALLAASELTPATLLSVAKRFALDPERYAATRQLGGEHPQLVADRDQASDLGADGTPYFFINGRPLAGAQPLATFEQLLQAEFERVRQLQAKQPTLQEPYAALQAQAAVPPALVPRPVPAPDANSPSLGPAAAPVVIQMFSDFECGYCQRVMPTLQALQAKYPEQVRVVFRHLPLSFHQHARAAARVALAVHQRGGDTAFWEFTRRLFGSDGPTAQPQTPEPLTAARLVTLGEAVGLAPGDAQKAMHATDYDAQIERDTRLAQQLGLSGTPSFVINGYVLVGAQPLPRFERMVRLALQAPPPPLPPHP